MAIIFLDLDGTTLDKGKPAEGIIETIALLKANHHQPIIATGRVPRVLYGIQHTLGIEDYIAANGQYIYYHQQVIYQKFIPKATVERLVQFCNQKQLDLVLASADAYVAIRKSSDVVDQFSDIYHIEYPEIDPTYHIDHDIFAGVFFSEEWIDDLRQLFPELQFNKTNTIGYDINLKGDLKADAVRWLIQYLDYPMSDVYAIGDGLNDLSMLSTVEHSIAMGNAHPHLKAVASFVTKDVTDGGIEHAFKTFHLI